MLMRLPLIAHSGVGHYVTMLSFISRQTQLPPQNAIAPFRAVPAAALQAGARASARKWTVVIISVTKNERNSGKIQ